MVAKKAVKTTEKKPIKRTKKTEEIKEVKEEPKVQEVKEPEEIKEVKEDKTEETKPEEINDKKRRFNIYYEGELIEGACVTGLRPKQAALKALSVIINNKFKDKKTKKVSKDAIGKEIKFYLTESSGYGKNKTFKYFFYKGSKNYIVTKDTMEEYRKKMKIAPEFETDKDGVIGVVANHKNKNGEIKKIVHKYINVVLMDREANKEFKMKQKEEKKQEKEINKTEKKQIKTKRQPRKKKAETKTD